MKITDGVTAHAFAEHLIFAAKILDHSGFASYCESGTPVTPYDPERYLGLGLLPIVRQPRLRIPEDFEDRLAVRRREMSEIFRGVLAGENLPESPIDVIEHRPGQTVEALAVD